MTRHATDLPLRSFIPLLGLHACPVPYIGLLAAASVLGPPTRVLPFPRAFAPTRRCNAAMPMPLPSSIQCRCRGTAYSSCRATFILRSPNHCCGPTPSNAPSLRPHALKRPVTEGHSLKQGMDQAPGGQGHRDRCEEGVGMGIQRGRGKQLWLFPL